SCRLSHCSAPPSDIHPSPTRRSSDLVPEADCRHTVPGPDEHVLGARCAPVAHGQQPDLPEQRGVGGPKLPTVLTGPLRRGGQPRSEEHTSELQSRFDLVCRLLLEKKK